MPTSNTEELGRFLKCTVIGRGVFGPCACCLISVYPFSIPGKFHHGTRQFFCQQVPSYFFGRKVITLCGINQFEVFLFSKNGKISHLLKILDLKYSQETNWRQHISANREPGKSVKNRFLSTTAPSHV